MERGLNPNPLANHNQVANGIPATTDVEPKNLAGTFCPACKGEKLYSVYRDGGSTLYCGECGVDNGVWGNPNFKKR